MEETTLTPQIQMQKFSCRFAPLLLSQDSPNFLRLGLSLFVVRECNGLGTYEGVLNRIDTTAPADGWSAIRMLVPKQFPLTFVMDGKLYVFGGNVCAPLVVLFDPHLVPSTSLPLHPLPCFPSDRCFNLVIAALQPSKKILVASADVAFVFNVVDQVWEELDHKDDKHYDDTTMSLFHCAKIRVSIYTDDQGESRFDAVVVASQSYALLGRNEHLVDAHVFLVEEDEGEERGSGLVGQDHGIWERCGYGSGRRIASSIAPYKICSKCSLPGHMERDCK